MAHEPFRWRPTTLVVTSRRYTVGFMIAAGAHPRVIQRRAGHASVRTTFDVYGSVLPEVDEALAADLGATVTGEMVTSGQTVS